MLLESNVYGSCKINVGKEVVGGGGHTCGVLRFAPIAKRDERCVEDRGQAMHR